MLRRSCRADERVSTVSCRETAGCVQVCAESQPAAAAPKPTQCPATCPSACRPRPCARLAGRKRARLRPRKAGGRACKAHTGWRPSARWARPCRAQFRGQTRYAVLLPERHCQNGSTPLSLPLPTSSLDAGIFIYSSDEYTRGGRQNSIFRSFSGPVCLLWFQWSHCSCCGRLERRSARARVGRSRVACVGVGAVSARAGWGRGRAEALHCRFGRWASGCALLLRVRSAGGGAAVRGVVGAFDHRRGGARGCWRGCRGG